MTGVQTCALPICFPVTIFFGKGERAKYMIEFFVKRLLGEITDDELEETVNGMQREIQYIFDVTPQAEYHLGSSIPVGDTIYGTIISKQLLEDDATPKE